jgi:hypothetical protein
MSKSSSLNKIASVLLIALVFSVAAFGQSDDLQTDLKSSFSKLKLIRLDNQIARQNTFSRQSLTISTAGKNYELNLTPHDLRARNYRAEETSVAGVLPLEKTAVTTFKGTIAGELNSQVRLTIDAGKVEGYFTSRDGKFYIEPASNYSRLAAAEDLIVYQEEDFLRTETFACALEDKIERGKEMVGANRLQTTLRVIEIATEADFAFVSELGGAAQANSEILGILNLIEGNYEAELGLTFDVVFQHAWTTPDPFDGSTASNFLNSFRTFWNANYPQIVVPRDAAHLFTSRANFNGRGLSYLGTICVNPNSAYGFTGRLDVGLIKYVLTAHEIGHNLNANHAEAAQGCDNTIMNATVSNITPVDFCPFSRVVITNFVAASGSCLSPRIANQTKFDFDGDGKADESVFRPLVGAWYLNQSRNGFTGVSFGLLTDKIVPADYDGDGKTDVAVYRAGIWFRLKSSTNTFDGVAFGAVTDIPAPADFDGDGKADVVVFRPADGVWHRLLSANNAYTATAFGQAGDVPVAADYDADGKADLNVFRPSSGAWFRFNSGNGAFSAVTFGQNGDKPLAGDFDGDGKADAAVFRPSDGGWYALRSSNNSLMATAFGFSTDMPAPADYDGDGKTDICVFRSGNWFRLNSSNSGFVATAFGTGGDVPVPSFYIP